MTRSSANLRIEFESDTTPRAAVADLASAVVREVDQSGHQVIEAKGDWPAIIVAIGKGAAASAALVKAIGTAISGWTNSKGEADAARKSVITFTHTSDGKHRTTKFRVATDSPEIVLKGLRELLGQEAA